MMKLNSSKFLTFAAVFLCFTATSFGGSLQIRDVARDPAWVLHVDCDALKKTELGQFILNEMSKPEAERKLAAFQTIFGLDPRKKLHGLTVYNPSSSQEDGTLLVYADFDADRLTTLAEGAKEHESTKHNKFTIHSWLDERKAKKTGGNPRTYSAIYNGKVIIFAQKERRVADALDVLAGSKANLAESKTYSRISNANSSFLVGAASKLDLLQGNSTAAVFKQAKMFSLRAGESNGNLDVTLNLETDNEDIAKQIESVGKGLVGLLALQKEKTNSVKLAEGLSIEQTNNEVMAKLSLPSSEVLQMIKSSPKKKSDD